MAETTLLLSQFYIKLAGSEAPEDMMHNLIEATVENSLHLPDVATLVLHDPNHKWVDESQLAPGTKMEISAKAGEVTAPLFDGEIVELESDFVPGEVRVIVRAFDRLHRLSRGRQVRSFLNVSDSDIITNVAKEVGLQPHVTSSSHTVHDYVLQDNTTNLEFLRERAAMLGNLLYVDGQKLHCEPYAKSTTTIDIAYGTDLREFHPRLTTIDQVSSATATGWDPKQREAVLGQAESPNGSPSVGVQNGGQLAASAFSITAKIQIADRPIRSQSVAQSIAQASLDRRAGRFIEADGTTRGNPHLRAGVGLKLSGLGTRFSGTYFVTAATHSYTADAGYVTHFMVSGFHPSSLLSVLGPERDGQYTPRAGVVVGIVTDNSDPDGMGRVKVKFPWLTQDHASDWARVVVPGGGSQRGMQFLPEVNDEVLVAFEHGDINYPYVLGGLWNGQDAPPNKNSELVEGGKVKQRVIRSRSGHVITLDDSDDKPSITIVDNTGKNTIKLESSSNKLTVHLEGDMVFEAPSGDIAIKSKTITMTATDAFKVKGQSFDAQADTSLNVKAGTQLQLEGTAGASLKGAKTDVKADSMLSMGGNATTQITGGVIQVG